jgi:hypothetical protein
MNIKDDLTCKYCNELYNQPITLNCCGKNICKKHIDELVSNNSSSQFMCPLCNQNNSNQNFHINELLVKLITRELHEFKLDSKYEISFKNLKKEIENLEIILKDPENLIYEEIRQLKFHVDLDREKLKLRIDQSADDIIQKLETYEKTFKNQSKKIDLENYNGIVESSRKHLIEYEKFLSLFSVEEGERDEKCSQNEKEISKLQFRIKKLKNELFSNLSINYKPIANSVVNLFGELIVKVMSTFN